MDNQELTIPGVVFLVLLLICVLWAKLTPMYSVIIGLIGFGVAYYFLRVKTK